MLVESIGTLHNSVAWYHSGFFTNYVAIIDWFIAFWIKNIRDLLLTWFQRGLRCIRNIYHNALISVSVWIVEPKGALVLWKFKFGAKNHLVKVGTLNWCIKHTVYIHKGIVQHHLCLIEGISLPLKGKQGVFSIKSFP